MKAIYFSRYGGPEVLEYADVPKPVPKDDEVLVKAKSIGIGKPDFLMRTGAYQWNKDRLPFIPGTEMAGEIVEVGAKVTGFSVGQLVHLTHYGVCGCYAEYKAVPAKFVTALPAGTDVLAAGAAMFHFIVWGMLKEACRGTDDRTLYIGGAAGGIGAAVCQLAPLLGFEVIASGSTEQKCDFIRKQGAKHVFNHKTDDPIKKVLELTDGRGVDIVLEQVIGKDFCRKFEMVADLGLIVIYSPLGDYPKDDVIRYLIEHFDRCLGVRAYSAHIHDRQEDRFAQNKREVFQMMAEGKISPFISRSFPLSEARQAHEYMDSGEALGKVILTVE